MKIGFHKDIFKPSLLKSTAQTVLNLKNALSTIQSRLQAQDFTGMTKDDVLGSLLYTTAVSYYAEYDMMDQMQARMMGVAIARIPSDAIFSVSMNVSYMFGVATSISPAGLKMDVQRNLEITEAVDANNNNVIQYMLASGMNSSALENNVPEQLFSTPTNSVQGILAVKAIKIANDRGIPIYTINQNNINTVMQQLQLNSDVISVIQDAVNAGDVVTIPKTNISFNGWVGVGYIITDPNTGEGAYMISGALGGAVIVATILMPFSLMIALGEDISAILSLLTDSDCLKTCLSSLANDVRSEYLNCLKRVTVGSVAIGVLVPILIVLFEPYLLAVLIPAIILTTSSTLFITVDLCSTKAAILLISGALGCIAGCVSY